MAILLVYIVTYNIYTITLYMEYKLIFILVKLFSLFSKYYRLLFVLFVRWKVQDTNESGCLGGWFALINKVLFVGFLL